MGGCGGWEGVEDVWQRGTQQGSTWHNTEPRTPCTPQTPEAGTYIETSMALLSPISVRHFMVTFLKAATCRNYSDRVSDNAVTAGHAHTDLQTCRHTYVYTLCTLIFCPFNYSSPTPNIAVGL